VDSVIYFVRVTLSCILWLSCLSTPSSHLTDCSCQPFSLNLVSV